MKQLTDYISEALLGDSLLEKFDNWTDFCNAHKTLLDCVSGYLIAKSKKSVAPNKIAGLSETAKLLKQKYSVPQVTDRNDKKLPAIMGEIFAAVASQVQIDWTLDPKMRLDKAIEEFKEVFTKIKENDLNAINFEHVWSENRDKSISFFNTYGLPFDIGYTNHRNGRRTVIERKEIVATFCSSYGTWNYVSNDNGKTWEKKRRYDSGEFEFSLLGSSPLMVDESEFDN